MAARSSSRHRLRLGQETLETTLIAPAKRSFFSLSIDLLSFPLSPSLPHRIEEIKITKCVMRAKETSFKKKRDVNTCGIRRDFYNYVTVECRR